MQVLPYPHPALRYKSVDVKQIDGKLRSTIAQMFELMYEANGIGLAANQVGLPFRFFIVNLAGRAGEPDEELVFINPVIKRRKGTEQGEEGCLSLPGLYADVKRSESLVVEAFDLDGEGFEMDAEELPARVVQHELDHLDGVMFTDKLAEAACALVVSEDLAKFDAMFRQAQASGLIASDEMLLKDLHEMAQSGIPVDFIDRPHIEFPIPKIIKSTGKTD